MIVTDTGLFDFMLSDKNGNKYYYSIMADNKDKAINIGAKWFAKEYNNEYTDITMNVSGYPLSRNY